MKSHARVAVIGGGVVGASVLYHLVKAGWTDAVLIERDELTSGSTWHAAGGMHTLNGDPNVAKLQEYTIKLYREIEEASGQSCSIHITGGVDLAGTRERMDFLKVACGRARYLGLDMEIISVDEAARLFPLMDKQHFVGALYNPLEGHVDPAGVTQAYAKAARKLGADVYRFTRVTGLSQRADGSWDVHTDKGDLHAEHVVNAAGLWAREVGRFVGLELPVLAMEHQYLVTGDMPEVIDSATEKMGFPKEKVVVNVDRFGNTSSGSIPLALADAAEDGMLEPGALVLMTGMGAGLTWGSALIEWTNDARRQS